MSVYSITVGSEILLLTLCDYIDLGTLLIPCRVFPSRAFVLTVNVLIPPKPFDYSGGLAALRFFLSTTSNGSRPHVESPVRFVVAGHSRLWLRGGIQVDCGLLAL